MNYKDAIASLDRSRDTETNIDVFLRLFGMYEMGWDDEFNRRVKANYIETWLCTDTFVGIAIIFFDDQPIGVTTQTARKNTMKLNFFVGVDDQIQKLQQLLAELSAEPELDRIAFDDNVKFYTSDNYRDKHYYRI